METLFRKEGRRYVPVREWSPEWTDSLPAGAHLLVVQPGRKSTRFNVQPAHAPILAAIEMHRDMLEKAASEATRPTPTRKLTRRELKAWKAYQAATGAESLSLSVGSAMSIVDALERAILEAK